jgi:hypothetical protein
MIPDWVSFLAYTNLFGIKGFVAVVVVVNSPAFLARIVALA